jgi:RNA polymerase sigma-70 factor (ECF subfamily)
VKSTDCVTGIEPAAADDVELVRLALTGDTDAFGELVERPRRGVFRAALAALGSPAEADDVAQEAFVTAFHKLAQFRGESTFSTWLLAIAWRKAADRRKRITRWLQLIVMPTARDDDRPDPVEIAPSRDRSQEDALGDAELHRHVRRLIATLPHKLRDALLLAGSGEYSYEQIGGMLHIPTGTVKWRVSEARRVLRRKLTALGYAHD